MRAAFSSFNYGKYKGILVSVALFLLLDASVLMLNFFISFQIADDAVDVNLAGRQRMLTQRMAKTLYSLEGEFNQTQRVNPETTQELLLSLSLFDQTFYAFKNGGTAKGATGNEVSLSAVTDEKAVTALTKAQERWEPYKTAIQTLLNNIENSSAASNALNENLQSALVLAREHNIPLLVLMNDLTVALENVATSKANTLRIIQTIGISLAIMNFLFILLHFIRQLKESDEVLEAARNETIEILNTVQEGLFLVDENLIIGTQHSKNIENILGQKDIAGQSFRDLLDEIINPKEAKTTAEFIGLLFNPKIKEKLIGDLNPLNQVQVNINNDQALPENRHLSFNFSRAMSGDTISHVLITVSDITERVRLSYELNAAKEKTDKQVEMLTGLLHANPKALNDFIANGYATFKRINDVLKSPGKTYAVMKEKLDSIYIEVHNFKGDAGALKLENFAERAHSFEDAIIALKNKSDLVGNDFLSLTVFLDELIIYTQQVDSLAKKMAEYSADKTQEYDEPSETSLLDLKEPLDNTVSQVALKQHKDVALVCSGLSEIKASKPFIYDLRLSLIQLLKNAVTHGIETASEREALHKKHQGRIDVRLAMLNDHMLEVVVQDDGAGIHYEKLRTHALADEQFTPSQVAAWDQKRLLAFMFSSGVSTAAEVTQEAGRGIGMPAVLAWVNRHGGKLKVASQANQYTRFTLLLPIDTALANTESSPA